MRILQIINSLGTGGAEKLLLDTIPLYREAGIEMDLLLLWNDNHPFVDSLRALDCCNIIILHESGSYRDIYNPINIFRLKKYLKNYNIAHVHLFPAQYYAIIANLLNVNSCKLIFTEHNIFNRRIRRKIFLPVERFIYKRYSKIVCISQEIKDIFSKTLNIRESIFELIPNGVCLAILEKAEKLEFDLINQQLNPNDKLILQVSAFRPQKDQVTAIKALCHIDEKSVKLIFVGDGECKANCENLVEVLGLTRRVFFLNQRIDVPSLLKSSTIILLSSHYEGLSLSSIEGMASGKPFISSNVPGLKNIVQGAGILFEHGNEKELAAKIKELLSNETYYNQIVKSCQERARQYDISVMVRKHINLYKEVYES